MEVIRGRGLSVKAGGLRLWLDSSPRGPGLTLISHAHSDHSPSRLVKVVTTPETASVLRLFRRGEIERELRYGEVLKIDGVEVVAHPSGHVFGSSQFSIKADGSEVVYTGDLNTYDSVILKGADPIRSDELIVEATYGSPRYVFPPREIVYADIVRWILEVIREGAVPAFKVYALGKAQEIIGLVNSYLDVPVVASWTVSKIAEKHRQHGLTLDFLPINSEEGLEAFRQGECVYVSNRRGNPPAKRRLRWAVATGWAIRYRFSSYEAAFPLSGHADFPGLINHVLETGAKKVYVVHGFAEELARNLRKLGVNASALDF